MEYQDGATQSGKTYLDTLYLIPARILERKGKEGLNFIVGVTKETIERNVLSKMRVIWGTDRVSEINSKNRANIFGEMVYCIGAKDKGQAAAFRGATAKYLYMNDEILEEMEELKTKEAKLYKALDKMEAVIQHDESDIASWLPLEYDLQLTYGSKEVAFSPYLMELKKLIDEWTRDKIAKGK